MLNYFFADLQQVLNELMKKLRAEIWRSCFLTCALIILVTANAIYFSHYGFGFACPVTPDVTPGILEK